MACNFRPNETLKHNPQNPHCSILFFFCTWLPPPRWVKKRHLANFSSYLIRPLKKKVPDPNISWQTSDHGSSNVSQKMRAVHPLATPTPACAQLGASLSWLNLDVRMIFAGSRTQEHGDALTSHVTSTKRHSNMPSVLWSVRYPAPKTWVLPAQCSSRKGLW